ncbi:hypothetical protein Q0F99_00900 [Rathayibacter oskolensis]|uniref:hypothetical protein n=1 Tax=Rathayibacter oskolensis TaxID=1891671 RepID=UPI00265FF26D|nr:hypothetical protein [Rathayibacter oskolensis]WKK71788.1 hypothetical protein Q0F99_00900 [Rathayibacter oskolensis]
MPSAYALSLAAAESSVAAAVGSVAAAVDSEVAAGLVVSSAVSVPAVAVLEQAASAARVRPRPGG